MKPLLLFGPSPEHLCEADRSRVSSCSKIKQTGGVSSSHVNVLCRSSNAVSFFPSLWHWRGIAPAAGILWDRQRLAPRKKSTNELRFAVLWLIYLCIFLLDFLFLLWRMWLVGFYNYFRLEWGNLGCRKLDKLKTEPDKIVRVKRSNVIWIICS